MGKLAFLLSVIMISVVISLVVGIHLYVGQVCLLTKGEAIEISRNSELVQRLLDDADRYTLEVHHQNRTNFWDRGVWHIVWYIHPEKAPSAFAYVASHTIDDRTGEILDEGTASLR